jgi:hypothetical protein
MSLHAENRQYETKNITTCAGRHKGAGSILVQSQDDAIGVGQQAFDLLHGSLLGHYDGGRVALNLGIGRLTRQAAISRREIKVQKWSTNAV